MNEKKKFREAKFDFQKKSEIKCKYKKNPFEMMCQIESNPY